jgi:DNA-binding CsgD family transcriptional regulator
MNELEIINTIRFSLREIDIIACLISGKSTKAIALFLKVAPKTVETHIRNIKSKVNCSSKEELISFIEKSNKYSLIIGHYRNLIISDAFEKILQGISVEMSKKQVELQVICAIKETREKEPNCCELIKHLSVCGIKATMEYKTMDGVEILKDNVVMLCSDEQALQFTTQYPEQSKKIIFCSDHLLYKDNIKNIRCNKENNYYFAVLELITLFYNNTSFEESIARFKAFYIDKNFTIHENSHTTIATENNKLSTKFLYLFGVFALIISGVFFLKYSKDAENIVLTTQFVNADILLPRNEIIAKIDAIFQKQKKPKLAILIGEGGSGKTVISRRYLQIKNIQVKAEINAETYESASSDFMNLAIILANTKELRERLSYIQTIPDNKIKNRQLILFVFSKLQTINDWCLLFDNVDDFNLVREFIPDQNIQKNGKIIITSRNKNPKNFISVDNIISIGNLSSKEQMELFLRILYGHETLLSRKQLEEAKNLLQNIPCMPLDVCAAAYYLKNTQIHFEEYLKLIKISDKSFEKMQSIFLMEEVNYSKSRYGILSSVFNLILKVNADFKELLLFICLLDSQNIPLNLLEKYKNPVVVGDFIRTLKRFSLITEKGKLLSLHRNNQEIGLKHILSSLSLEEKERFCSEIVHIMTPYDSIAWNWYEVHNSSKMSQVERKGFVIHAKSLLKKMKSYALVNVDDKYNTLLLLSILYASADTEPCDKMHVLAEEILRLNNFNHCVKNADLAVLILYTANLARNGNKKRCEELCHQCITYCSKISSATNISIMAKVYLARLYFDWGRFSPAIALLDEIEAKIAKGISTNAKSVYTAIVNQFFICSINYYINKQPTDNRSKYLYKALQISGGAKMCHVHDIKIDNLLHNNVILSDVVALRLNLIRKYNVFGNTAEAMKNCLEIKFLYDQMDKIGIIPPEQELVFKKEYAHTLLRNNNVQEAYELLSDILRATDLHGSMCSFAVAIVYKSEADIRLGKFAEAYDDCKMALAAFAEESNYVRHIKCQCLYNMAIAKYRMLDFPTALRHFYEFFKASQEFCRNFLTEQEFNKLENQGVFENTENRLQMNESLKNSQKIFAAIYGSDHPLVIDYIAKNGLGF